jgi:hypothetical protein
VTTLHRWMEEARKTGIHSLVRFVRTLKQDLSAVESAVSEPWSNGPVEGQLNRLKMLKRQTEFGRRVVAYFVRFDPRESMIIAARFRLTSPAPDRPKMPTESRCSLLVSS